MANERIREAIDYAKQELLELGLDATYADISAPLRSIYEIAKEESPRESQGKMLSAYVACAMGMIGADGLSDNAAKRVAIFSQLLDRMSNKMIQN